ncbi:MAG: glycosyltransferase [Prolixibacteraceae bacterium]|nr:glycosyltransferase [Prolixibacteraceae bacterium]MBN2774719.1 glycosyltransferase [Prolixibacteraceae bacterium]
MKLSVVIVNYNVKYFLEQCLHSVQKAVKDIPSEIFVVDNNSVDGSVNLVKEKFPEVILIENKENYGFSRANNQAINITEGDYILLLNPDTVVEEDTFKKTLAFMDQTPDAGGLGVKMIDGKGNFLPESKRGLPSPWVAFYKIFGFSRLFPKSKRFGKYHLSYLDENQIHEVDVLSGAFMLLRKPALNRTGLLDETFFMYGEDIDLSYRIKQAGFKNYYFPETTIIHYKGESTKKGSVNYVRIFYKAMIIFAQKHFSGGKARMFSFLINMAIYFRAIIAVLGRLFSRLYLPLLDVIIIFSGYLLITPLWERLVYEPGHYPPEFLNYIVPVYILLWLLGILISGGYRKPIKLYLVIRGLFWGTITILLAYSLIDEQYRFSRALILLGSVWAIIMLPFFRFLLSKLKIKDLKLDLKTTRRIAIVGHPEEVKRVKNLLDQTRISSEFIGNISIENSDQGKDYIGHISQLEDIIRINRINELIFCAENLSSGKIIKAMLDLSKLEINYKIAPPESLSIIGSNSIHTSGDFYVVNVNAISRKRNKRMKRIIDISFGFLLLITSPVLFFFYLGKGIFFSNIFKVLKGEKSWVGYIPDIHTHDDMPELKPGILNPSDQFSDIDLDDAKKTRLNLNYARDYQVRNDLEIIIKNLNKLARKIEN